LPGSCSEIPRFSQTGTAERGIDQASKPNALVMEIRPGFNGWLLLPGASTSLGHLLSHQV
jgi:hypothetical protein